LARRPRIWVVEEEQAQAVAEIKALAELLPVTDIPDDAVPVDLQISIRDQARDVLERGAGYTGASGQPMGAAAFDLADTVAATVRAVAAAERSSNAGR